MKDLSTTLTRGFNVNKINPLWYLAIGVYAPHEPPL